MYSEHPGPFPSESVFPKLNRKWPRMDGCCGFGKLLCSILSTFSCEVKETACLSVMPVPIFRKSYNVCGE